MRTYSKKVSKRTERAERSSSSGDDRVGKEQPDPPKKHLNVPVHHQKMMKVTKEVEKHVELIKIN